MPIGRSKNGDAGAVVVEFALVLPLLILLVFGIAEFGRAYHTQVTLTHAAREGARAMALTGNASCDAGPSPPMGARRVTVNAAQSINLNCGEVDIVSACAQAPPGNRHTVTAQRNFALNIPLFPGNSAFLLRGVGVMRCGG